MACVRLFTRPPSRPLPERSVPRFLLRIALATVLLAPLLYLRRERDLLAAMIRFEVVVRSLLRVRIVGVRQCEGIKVLWWVRQDLNLGPTDYESARNRGFPRLSAAQEDSAKYRKDFPRGEEGFIFRGDKFLRPL